jgi:hypothetical protein
MGYLKLINGTVKISGERECYTALLKKNNVLLDGACHRKSVA